MKFRKYEFTPEKWAELKSDLQIAVTEGNESELFYNRDIIESVVEIGYLIESQTEDEVILSDKFSVDILWKNEELESFAPYKIWCTPVGIHSFGPSIDSDYEQAYLEQLAN